MTVTPFFGGGVTLTAQNGIYAEGANGGLITGPAALALHTPYIGDRATPLAPGVNAVIPALTLSSSNAVTIDNVGVGIADSVDGIPGASVAISGQSVSVSGTTIHATAGSVTLTSATGITLGNGAVIEAPGYSKIFGDAADPTSQSAPGGTVALIAQNGDIALGNATLSVGGGTGDAGTLSLSAPNGAVTGLATATLNGTPGTGGAGGHVLARHFGGGRSRRAQRSGRRRWLHRRVQHPHLDRRPDAGRRRKPALRGRSASPPMAVFSPSRAPSMFPASTAAMSTFTASRA